MTDIRTLKPFDGYIFKSFDVVDGFLYGYRNAHQYARFGVDSDINTGNGWQDTATFEALWNADTGQALVSTDFLIRGVFVFDGFAYCSVEATAGADSGASSVFRFDVDGTNGKFVTRLGDFGGTWRTGVRLLSDNSMNEGVIDGNAVIAFAEYNTNVVDTPKVGRVFYINKSDITDSVVGTVNVAVNFNETVVMISHVHGIQYNTLDSSWYVPCGDSDTQAGIIKWNGTATWPSGASLTWATVGATSGFTTLYSADQASPQWTRAISMVFRSDFIYWTVDENGASNQGVVRVRASDFDGLERVMDNTLWATGFTGWFTFEYQSRIFACSYWDTNFAGAADGYISFFSSATGESGTWVEVGRWYIGSSTIIAVGGIALPSLLKSSGDKLYFSSNGQAKQSAERTHAYTLGNPYENFAASMAPCFFVGSVGRTGRANSDSTTRTAASGNDFFGMSSRFPWATVANALSHCSFNSHVSLIAGDDFSSAAEIPTVFNNGTSNWTTSPGTDPSAAIVDKIVMLSGVIGSKVVSTQALTGSGVIRATTTTEHGLYLSDIEVQHSTNNSFGLISNNGFENTWTLGRGAKVSGASNSFTAINNRKDTVTLKSGSLVTALEDAPAELIRMQSAASTGSYLTIEPGAVLEGGGTVQIVYGSGVAQSSGVKSFLNIDGATFKAGANTAHSIDITNSMAVNDRPQVINTLTDAAMFDNNSGFGADFTDTNMNFSIEKLLSTDTNGTYNTDGETNLALVIEADFSANLGSASAETDQGNVLDFYGNAYQSPFANMGAVATVPADGSPTLTTPYSINIAPGDTAGSATDGVVSNVVAGKMKLFLGSTVDLTKRQSIVGNLTKLFNYMMTNAGRGIVTSGDIVVFGDYVSLSQADITLTNVTSGIGNNDAAIVVSSSFGSAINQTIEYREAFRRLIAQFLTRSTGN